MARVWLRLCSLSLSVHRIDTRGLARLEARFTCLETSLGSATISNHTHPPDVLPQFACSSWSMQHGQFATPSLRQVEVSSKQFCVTSCCNAMAVPLLHLLQNISGRDVRLVAIDHPRGLGSPLILHITWPCGLSAATNG